MKLEALSLQTIIKKFSKENSYYYLKRKDLLLLSNKLIEKIADPRNAKQHYESFFRKKNMKSVKQSQTITYQSKAFAFVDIKSFNTGHPKPSHKLSKTIRQTEK